ncbi:MAG: chromate transporter [Clostridia bacterium]|nr:chromate transporter [Clostridia bacterium]
MPLLLDLFLTFLKIGAVSFGGGYAMIPMLTDEVIAHGWLTETELLNFIAVSESTPGPIAVNMATFIGSAKGGFLGALLATVGVVLPAFIIILIVASIVKGLLKYAGVKGFLSGVRPVVVGLIIATGALLFLTVVLGYTKVGAPLSFDYKSLIIFGIVALTYIVYKILRKKTLSPIILIIFSALLGLLFYGLL